MMLSVGKIFWLIIILIAVWYLFKIIEKRKLNIGKKNQKQENDDKNKKGIEIIHANMTPPYKKTLKKNDLKNII